ncbi:hypothetical protein CH380_09675 [Leptospira adleri]|uniref:Glycosyltransferase RgtA/B/C/D-like domain-containing protein n=2 Tax=Leptospira adleri TaxID=2023186 RepID=A0A2M9YPI5_9LEPT|nr:hypothetical protein CH380_09675 [Leptospira adleri]PJZ63033.1 hypothetical protein CH376_05035 [Leptospira adleri]
MNILFLILLFFPVVCYPILVLTLPVSQSLHHSAIVPLVSALIVFFLKFFKIFELEFPVSKRSSPSKIYSVCILFLLGFSIYFFQLRTSIEPLGMWDAWAMWSPKTKYLVSQFFAGEKIDLDLREWPHPDYPLGYPLFASFFGILSGKWSPIIQVYASFYFYFLGFYFFIRMRRSLWISALVLLIYCTFFKWIMLSTDLCADLPLSVYFSFCFYFLIERIGIDRLKFRTQRVAFGFFFGALSFWKNEGFVLALVLFAAFSIQLYEIEGKNCYRKLSFFALGFLSAVCFVLFQKLNSPSALPNDFIQNEDVLSSILKLGTRLTSIDRWNIVMAEKIRFQLRLAHGFYILIFAYSFIFGKKEVRFGVILLLLLSLLYDLFFVITNADLQWHLETAYDRIHFHFFLPSLICLSLASEDEGKMTENPPKFQNEAV